jgi:hypothetical protein
LCVVSDRFVHHGKCLCWDSFLLLSDAAVVRHGEIALGVPPSMEKGSQTASQPAHITQFEARLQIEQRTRIRATQHDAAVSCGCGRREAAETQQARADSGDVAWI